MTEIKILTIENLEEIRSFESAQLEGSDIEKEIASWHARWRKESLEHYLPLGWSFGKRVDSKLVAYVLCQPLLFFEGWTQSLWIEHVAGTESSHIHEMIEVAYRWARDKHLQKVFFNTELKTVNETTFAKIQNPIEVGSFSSTKL